MYVIEIVLSAFSILTGQCRCIPRSNLDKGLPISGHILTDIDMKNPNKEEKRPLHYKLIAKECILACNRKDCRKGLPKGMSDEQDVLPCDCQFGQKEDFNLKTLDIRVDFAQQSYNILHMRSRQSCI